MLIRARMVTKTPDEPESGTLPAPPLAPPRLEMGRVAVGVVLRDGGGE
jgi:hypothetical protein